MRIVVIGGSGLIGSKLVRKLREDGHQVVAASLDSGVNTLTGEGLGRSHRRCRCGGRRIELPIFRGRGSVEVLRNIDPQTP